MTTTNVGRPRDRELDSRVFAAACELYGRKGWAGFSIETIARKAGVGKSSIYLRLPDKAALLVEGLNAQLAAPTGVDSGSVAEDLRGLAVQYLTSYLGPYGDAALRISADKRVVPEIAGH
jgi:AcrR family transcriptional regulator